MSLPAPDLAASPAQRATVLADLIGDDEFARWCADLLDARATATDTDHPSLSWLGGQAAVAALSRGDFDSPVHQYWLRVWGARGLLHVWAPGAAPAVRRALGDDHWRVREMAAKVIGAHEVSDADAALDGLLGDPVTRVAVAAARALALVGEAECAAALHRVADAPDASRSRAARAALIALSARLDRPL